MEHTALIRVSADTAELLVAVLDAIESEGTSDTIRDWIEDHPAGPAEEGLCYGWSRVPEEEPEVVLSLGFRFYGAEMDELEAVASQRRFEKVALDWHEGTLDEWLAAQPDIEAVYEEAPADPENGPEEPDFVCYRLGNVRIDIA